MGVGLIDFGVMIFRARLFVLGFLFVGGRVV